MNIMEELARKMCTLSGKVLVINVKVDRKEVCDRYNGYKQNEVHRYHAFRVIDMNGWWEYE